MKKYIFVLTVLILSICPVVSYASETAPQKWPSASITNVFTKGDTVSTNILSQYTPPARVFPLMYQSITNALCTTPEELMISDESTISQEWQNHNYLYPSETPALSSKAIEYRKGIHIPANGIELIGKLNIETQKDKYCILKFWLVDDGKKSLMVARIMKKHDDRWYFTSGVSNEIVEAVRRVKIEVLFDLMSDSIPSDFYDPQLYHYTRGEKNQLDINKLYKAMMLLREKRDWVNFFKLCDKNN